MYVINLLARKPVFTKMSFINYNYCFNAYNCGWIIEWVEGAPEPEPLYA